MPRAQGALRVFAGFMTMHTINQHAKGRRQISRPRFHRNGGAA
jgi:hypothetical protein